MGQISSGKSAFINSIISFPLLPSESGESTGAITEISYGKTPKLIYKNPDSEELQEVLGFAELSPEDKCAEIRQLTRYEDENSTEINLRRVFIEWPCP